jgi:hypothetical protein
VVANLDNGADGDDKLATGSLSGVLRVLRPGGQRERRVDDLLLEERLGAPILQLAAGRFLP